MLYNSMNSNEVNPRTYYVVERFSENGHRLYWPKKLFASYIKKEAEDFLKANRDRHTLVCQYHDTNWQNVRGLN